IGLALLIIWVGALQIMLDKGKDLDWFNSTFITGLAVTAILGFALFLVWELTDKHPVVELRLFALRNFWTGTLAISLGYGAFFGNVVLLPLWLQQHMGYTATLAGMALAPVGLLAILLAPLVGKNVNRVDPRIFATGAFVIFAIVMLMRSHFNTEADFGTILVPTVVQGAAVAIFFIPLITLSLSGLSPNQIPAATGLNNFVRISAGSFGTSITTTLWDHRASLHHAQLAENITSFNPVSTQAFANLQALGMNPGQSHAMVNRIIDQQAFMLSANDIFYASAILFLLLIPVIWLAKPVKGASSVPGGAH
ncbi:MAG: DHA2 family efflux MFS transporter permease subunit, partial [Burkholderiales bacterium]